MSERFDFTGDELAPAYRAAVDAIEAGDLVVMPTDTVYGLAADAFKADAVQRLLDAKGRGRDVPPPVLISVVESLDALATDVPDNGRKLCEEFWPGPLTVICHAQTSLLWDLGDTQGTVALRVPDHENTRELLSRTGPLAVSAANRSGQPAALDVYDAEEQLGDAVAVYLDGGEATAGEPSTIVDLTTDTPRVVRIGAVSLDQLRAIVPEVLTETGESADPTPDTSEAKPEDELTEDKPAEDKPAEDKPAEDKPAEDKPAEDKPAEDKPVDEKPAVDEPVDEKPAVDEPVDEKPGEVVGGEPTDGAVVASKQDEAKTTDPDVRPAD
ncbi:L-threonylcarbamoyladenylate synthase [Kribbella sp. NPDC003557]|uniref:L-threonylcarbamoyladenylate synthase n=1 Tax=Kribbella sp. NPDC003557 TaxID=3154449 RepID=UPI0033BBEAFD